jgi:uncharacterized protein YcbX
MTSVARISVTPVKGFRLRHPDEVQLDVDGVPGNRRFFVIGSDGARLRGSKTPWLALVTADYDEGAEQLSLRFPDGTQVSGSAIANGKRIHTAAGTLDLDGVVVDGPWTAPLSSLAGSPVRLVRADHLAAVAIAPATLVSDGSLARFGAAAEVDALDARRFRMLFELAGCEPHEEDGWEGRRFAIGEAVIRVGGGVDRCAVTTRDPETALRDLDTLRVLADYRGRREDDGAVCFGVYATVETAGRVRVGDRVEPV